MNRRELLAAFAGLAGTGALGLPARAQDWPARELTLVVPYPAGGTSDAQGRSIADFLTTQFSKKCLVENLEGASGITANRHVNQLPPDGLTLILQTSSAMVVVPQLKADGYDPMALLRPVANVYNHPIAIIVAKDSKYRSWEDVVAEAKKRPGEVTFASPGANSMYHMAGEIANLKAGIELLHVPYKGAAQYTVDLIGGRIDMAIGTLATAMTNDQVRPLLVGTPNRSTVAPEVQTATEVGMPELVLPAESGIFAHVETPDDLVARLADAIKGMIDDETSKSRLPGLKLEFNYMDEEQFATALAIEKQQIAELIKATGMTPG
jgi:tripartite-type tricarboxylate transporter receptor subunit TctC